MFQFLLMTRNNDESLEDKFNLYTLRLSVVLNILAMIGIVIKASYGDSIRMRFGIVSMIIVLVLELISVHILPIDLPIKYNYIDDVYRGFVYKGHNDFTKVIHLNILCSSYPVYILMALFSFALNIQTGFVVFLGIVYLIAATNVFLAIIYFLVYKLSRPIYSLMKYYKGTESLKTKESSNNGIYKNRLSKTQKKLNREKEKELKEIRKRKESMLNNESVSFGLLQIDECIIRNKSLVNNIHICALKDSKKMIENEPKRALLMDKQLYTYPNEILLILKKIEELESLNTNNIEIINNLVNKANSINDEIASLNTKIIENEIKIM